MLWSIYERVGGLSPCGDRKLFSAQREEFNAYVLRKWLFNVRMSCLRLKILLFFCNQKQSVLTCGTWFTRKNLCGLAVEEGVSHWIQQDGATSHNAREILKVLSHHISDREA